MKDVMHGLASVAREVTKQLPFLDASNAIRLGSNQDVDEMGLI